MLTVISVVFMVLGGLLSQRLKSKIEQYSAVPIDNGMTGAEIAHSMLKFYGINDVEIIQVRANSPITTTHKTKPSTLVQRCIAVEIYPQQQYLHTNVAMLYNMLPSTACYNSVLRWYPLSILQPMCNNIYLC